LYSAIFGGGSGAGGEFANNVTWFFNTITSAIGNVIKQARIMIEIFAIMIEATKAAFSGDFTTYLNKSMEFGAKLQEFMETVNDQWNQFSNSNFSSNFSSSGSIGTPALSLPQGINASSANTGDSVSTNMIGASSLDVYIHNASPHPIDRSTIQAIAEAMAKDLGMRGNKVTYAGAY